MEVFHIFQNHLLIVSKKVVHFGCRNSLLLRLLRTFNGLLFHISKPRLKWQFEACEHLME